jgi:hypothetical protein
MGDTGRVNRAASIVLIGMIVGACGGSSTDLADTTSAPTTTAPATTAPTTTALPVVPETSVVPASSSDTPPTSAANDPTSPDAAPPNTIEAAANGPAYDVFIAAVAHAVIGTRFEDSPFEEPEIFVSTGLLMCERLSAGFGPDEVTLEYLTELTGGDPSDADDDQLVLTGALLGAAEVALCPPTDDS